MQIYYFLLLLYFIPHSMPYFSCVFKENLEEICLNCPNNCFECNSTEYCNICDIEFFSLNGTCYPQCLHNQIATLINNQIQCVKIPFLQVSEAAMVTPYYHSDSIFNPRLVNFHRIATSIEITFWIKFEEIDPNSRELLLFWTEYREPIQISLHYPYLMMIEIINGKLIGPSHEINFPVQIFQGNWYFLSYFIEFAYQEHYSKDIGVFGFDSNKENIEYFATFERFISLETLPIQSFLYLGTFDEKKKRNKYEIQSFNLMALNQPRYIGKWTQFYGNINTILKNYFPILNRVSTSEVFGTLVPIESEIKLSDFSTYLLQVFVEIQSYELPYKVFELFVDGNLVFDCILRSKNKTIGAEFLGAFIEKKPWTPISLILMRRSNNYYFIGNAKRVIAKGSIVTIKLADYALTETLYLKSATLSEFPSIFHNLVLTF